MLWLAALYAACTPSVETLPFSTYRVFSRQDALYSSGWTIPEEGKPGNSNLVIFDISDPEKPAYLDEIDLKTTRVVAQDGSRLIGVKPGYDPADGSFENAEVVTYTLADPWTPEVSDTLELPGTHGVEAMNAGFLSGGLFYLASETHATDQSEPGAGTLLIDLDTGVTEYEIEPTCHAAVQEGDVLYCFSTTDYGSRDVYVMRLGADAEILAVSSDEGLSLPRNAISFGGKVLVADYYRGVTSYDVNSDGTLTEGFTADADGASALFSTTGSLLLGATDLIGVLDPLTGDVGGALGYSATSLGDTSKSGIYAAAMGNDGFLLFTESGGSLSKKGGYYHRWNTELFEAEQSEGNY